MTSVDRSSDSLLKTYLIFLGPMIVSNILQALSGTINNVYLGQMLGVGAMAAASAFFPLLFFCISFILGVGGGASVLIGQAYGARDFEKLKAVAGTALAVTLMLGLVIAVLGGLFTSELLIAIGTPADILADATAYARVMLIAMPAMFTFLLFTSMLRGVSDTLTPLLALGLSTLVGLLVTPALIKGWLGLPRLGVVSAAAAAVVSLIISLVWLAVHLRHRRNPLAPDADFLRHIRVEPRLLKAVLRIGLPMGVNLVMISLAEVAVLSLVNGFGSSATAAYGAVNQILNYVQFPALSISIAASILGAQAIGRGRADQLGPITRTGIQLNLVITGTMVAVAYLFSRPVIGWFITDEPVREMAQNLLHIILWSTLIFGCATLVAAVMRASGTVLIPTAISILCLTFVEVPVAWWLSRRMGIDGIWWAYPIAFTAMLVLQIVYYRTVWMKRPKERLI